MLKDRRDEPQYAERVPYLISNADGRRLIDRARMPDEMLANPTLGIDAEYYIRNLLVPPLARIFNLVGGDVAQWYDAMPRTKRVGKYAGASGTKIDAHFRSTHCRVCGDAVSGTAEDAAGTGLCAACVSEPDVTAYALVAREHAAQRRLAELHALCTSCSSTPPGEPVLCCSIDCPVTYARVSAETDAAELADVQDVLRRLDW
jgi:DNA polymerase zeta